MKYAIYDVLTTATPVRLWQEKTDTYVPAIYDNEAEANEKVRELNAHLLEDVYVVKPYTEEINLTLSREEAKAIVGLCSVAIPYLEKNGETEKSEVIISIQNKLKGGM